MIKNNHWKIVFILCSFTLTAASCGTALRREIKHSSVEKNEGPSIHFKKHAYDFGITGQDEEIHYDFEFQNKGPEILIIERIDTDCGCTVADPSKREFRQGEIGYINALFKTKRYDGKQEKKIYVYSNDHTSPKTELLITGTVTRYIGLQPDAVYCGEIQKGDDKTFKVKVFQIGPDELTIDRIESSSHHIHTTKKRFEDQNSTGFEVLLSLDPNMPAASFNEVITLYTNSKKRPHVDIPVAGRVLGNIQVFPRVLALGKIKKGTMLYDKLKVFSVKDNEFIIKEIHCELPYLIPRFSQSAKQKEYLVSVGIDKNAPSGRLDTSFEIYTDSREEPVIKVPISGSISY
ncbi:MAG: DUF1573 domain-containing protein [bacterium]